MADNLDSWSEGDVYDNDNNTELLKLNLCDLRIVNGKFQASIQIGRET